MIHYSRPRAAPAGPARVLAVHSVQARLVDAARDLVAEQGWQGAQIALIAARAGVATGSVYRHFASKADLFAHVLAKVSQREVDHVEGIARGPGPAERRLGDAVTTFMRRALAGRRLAYALIAEPCEPEIDRERLVYRAALARVFETLIAEGIAARRFRRTFHPRLLWWAATGSFAMALRDYKRLSARGQAPTLLDFAAAVAAWPAHLFAKRIGRPNAAKPWPADAVTSIDAPPPSLPADRVRAAPGAVAVP